jgi:hypothetical protein
MGLPCSSNIMALTTYGPVALFEEHICEWNIPDKVEVYAAGEIVPLLPE